MTATLTDHPSRKAGCASPLPTGEGQGEGALLSKPPCATTQSERILAKLIARAGHWVPMPDLAAIGSCSPNGFCMVHSRIADLRKRGYHIENETRHQDGLTHSFYKLIPETTTDH